MKNLSVSVPSPCKERWETFTPTSKGGHCESCQKEVIDFTGWNEQRIINYFKNGYGGCGRFRKDQLKTYTFPEPTSQTQHWAAILVLAIAAIFGSRNAFGQSKKQPVEISQSKDTIKSTVQPVSIKMKITGKVISKEDGLPLPGVSVVLKSTSLATVTDVDGYYEIEIGNRDNQTLSYSFIGLTTQEIDVKDKSVVNVSLEADLIRLGEPIVLGGAISVRRFSPRSLWWKIRHIF